MRYYMVMVVCCMAFCMAGCSSKEEAALIEEPSAMASVSETESVAGSVITEEEKIASLYDSCKEKTFCIFTSSNNNGTGFLYKDKYVITNEHVLYDADDFSLVDAAGQEHKGTLVFTDHASDLAIIQIDGQQGKSVQFGSASDLSVGETVLMIGNPANGSPFSYCTGKRVELEDELQQSVDRNHRYLPLDANLVSGYSGGPAFNLSGELVGISNAAFTGDLSSYGFEHLSFIITIDSVLELIEANCR